MLECSDEKGTDRGGGASAAECSPVPQDTRKQDIDRAYPASMAGVGVRMSDAAVAMAFVDHVIRVRFAETDAQGIVYYGNYLAWFEVARMEWMRANGVSWKAMGEIGRQLVVAHAEVDYHASARYDDEVRLRAFVERVGTKSCTIGYEIYRLPDEVLLTTGNTVLVCIDTETGGTAPLPALMRQHLTRGLEARSGEGQPTYEFSRGR